MLASSRRVRTVLAVLVTALAASLAAAPAAAADDIDAERLIARGIELRERGRDDEALAVFTEALSTHPSPRARAQVALAEQALGLWVAAETNLLLALSAVDDAWIARNRGALEGALAIVRRSLGSLEVRGTAGAEIMLDGVRLGVLPTKGPYRVEAGRRTLDIRANGFYPTTRSIEVPAGGVSRETVTLVPLGAPSLATPPAVAALAPAEGDAGHVQRVLGWGFVGTGGALVVTGALGLVVRKNIVDEYNVQCPGVGVGQSASCDEKISSARTWLTVSILTLVGGGLFTVGGLTLVATSPRRAARGPAGVRIGCAPALLGAACGGSF